MPISSFMPQIYPVRPSPLSLRFSLVEKITVTYIKRSTNDNDVPAFGDVYRGNSNNNMVITKASLKRCPTHTAPGFIFNKQGGTAFMLQGIRYSTSIHTLLITKHLNMHCRFLLLPALLFHALAAPAQQPSLLNTAKDCLYMKPEEREMVYEINRVRSNPVSYLQYIEPMLKDAKQHLQQYGRGERNYSLTYSTGTKDGREQRTVDTTWHYTNEEYVKALSTLVDDLKKQKKLSILQPDSGVYAAARKHAQDNNAHNWELLHTGSDGSVPWDRIRQFSPAMRFGNENIAGRTGVPKPRDIVIQLLVDAGIPGYGHRYNLLDPQWTHVGCTVENYKGRMSYWIQNFGILANKKPR